MDTCADYGHTTADWLLVLDHIDVREALGVLDAGNGRRARDDPRCNNNMVKLALFQLICCHALAEPNLQGGNCV